MTTQQATTFSQLAATEQATATEPTAAAEPTGAATAPVKGAFLDWLGERAVEREAAGLTRTLRPRPAAADLLDLASNDYLGLTRRPEVTAAAAAAAERWGAGSTGSRLVTGSTELHAEFERELAEFTGNEAALVFSSGYTANLGVVTALADANTTIVSDAYNHASLIDGCRLAPGRTVVTPHGSVGDVERALRHRETERALVVSDAVFSVDGDHAPLAGYAAACREHGAALIADDAHGLGVLGAGGRGLVHEVGLAGAPDVLTTVTLSKSFGAQGGAVLGPRAAIEHLVSNARTFIFDTGLAPSSVAAALAALRILRAEPELADRALAMATTLASRLSAAGLAASAARAAVVSVTAPTPQAAMAWAAECRARGVFVGCFRPPSVPDGRSRLRLTARANLTESEVERAVHVIAATAR